MQAAITNDTNIITEAHAFDKKKSEAWALLICYPHRRLPSAGQSRFDTAGLG